MKILKRPHVYTAEVTCTNSKCETVLEVEADDLRWFDGYSTYFENYPSTVSTRCPCCNEVFNIPEEKWPEDHTSLTRWSLLWNFGIEKQNS